MVNRGAEEKEEIQSRSELVLKNPPYQCLTL
jgi:hypothetical protein